jgi:hypothetical protein
MNNEMPVYFVCFTDKDGKTFYLSNLFHGDTWGWTSDVFDAKMFRQHSKAFKQARNCTDPEVGPTWYVRAGVVTLGDKV